MKKRDELADLIAETDDRLARLAHVESIQVANTQPQQKTMNPFKSKFWKTPRPIPVGVPVTTYRADDPEINVYKAEHDPEMNHFPDGKKEPDPLIAESNRIYNIDKPERLDDHYFGGSRRRHRRRRRTRR